MKAKGMKPIDTKLSPALQEQVDMKKYVEDKILYAMRIPKEYLVAQNPMSGSRLLDGIDACKIEAEINRKFRPRWRS